METNQTTTSYQPIGLTNSSFWTDHLAKAEKRISLPLDHSGTVLHSADFAFESFLISNKTADKLRLMGDQHRPNVALVMLTAFKILLYRHTYQNNIVIGWVASQNESAPNDDGNEVLPIFNATNEEDNFLETLQNVQTTYAEVHKHRHENIAAANDFSLEEDTPSDFYQQVLFKYQNNADDFGQHESPVNTDIPKVINPKITELYITLSGSAEGIAGQLYYNNVLFETDSIKQIIERYRVLIEEIAGNPQKKVSSLNILPEGELKKILFDWNDTEAGFPHDKCLHELFEEQVNLTPDAIAVEMYSSSNSSLINKKKLTYRELNNQANQTAHFLQSLGVGPETVVGIYMNRSTEMVVALLGILKAGAAYLPLDPAYPKERLEYIFNDSGISILLSQYKLITKLPALNVRVISLDVEWNKISQFSTNTPQTTVTPQNICYIIYTSGSTGLPKGTLILHRGVVNYLCWCIKAYMVHKGNGSPINSSLAFDATVTSCFSPLLAGKKILLLPEEGEIEALVDALQSKNKFSLIKITPAHLEILASLLKPENNDEQANFLVIGGEALTGKSLGYWRKYSPSTKLINEYGPTETVVGCCIYDIPSSKSLSEEIPIGRPIANTQIYILDRHLNPVPVGVPGEIYIGGEGLARGYLNRPALTAERFIKNPFDTNKESRLYKSGDVARYLKDGNIAFIGRGDKQVKVHGYRIELGEVEYALQNSGEVTNVTVVAKDDEQSGKRLVAYYVPDGKKVRERERALQNEWVANWKNIYESEYGQTENDIQVDHEFNLIGWNDSFTGGPIPPAHMKQWLDDIVGIVMKEKPQNVLEIGCGTGLIYFQLAGKVNKYIGFDLSESSINQIKKTISKKSREYGNTELYTAPAHLVQLKTEEQVDTILLNSMVQYFPGVDYMNDVIDRCMTMIGTKGRIIVGDVRDNRLLELFKAQLRLQKTSDDISLKEFKMALEQNVLKEEELCLSPAYFYRLKEIYPQVTHVEVTWKNVDFENELSRYRFTATIYIGINKPTKQLVWQAWDDLIGNEELFKKDGGDTIAIKNVPNPRLVHERLLLSALQNTSLKTIGDFKLSIKQHAGEINVLNLIDRAKASGYTCQLFVHQDPLKMNLVFKADASDNFINNPLADAAEDSIANTPLFSDIVVLMQKDIRKHLLDTLPKYMVPADIVALRRIPLTTNGKVDYDALPAAGLQRTDKSSTYTAGRNKLEIDVAALFGNILGLKKLGIFDDLFQLGLNSMQAYRVFAQIKKLTGKQLPLSILIEAPTVEKLAIHLAGTQSSLPWSSLVAIQPKGTKPPLYLIHAGAGTVLFYRELSLHLGDDQPVYGLQPVGLDGKKPFHKSVQEMATHYVKEIMAVNPDGPYILGGYCFGAVLSFEMALQLMVKNKKVALLCNFNGVSPVYDSGANSSVSENQDEAGLGHKQAKPDQKNNPVVTKPISLKNSVINNLKAVRRTVLFVWRPALYAKYINFLVHSYRHFQSIGLKAPENLRKYYFLLSNTEMVQAYKPTALKIPLVIFRSPGIYADPHLGWSNFIDGQIITIDIEGHHIDRRQIMNEPFVKHTAKELARHIEQFTKN